MPLAGKTGTCYSVDRATGTYNTGKKRLAFCGFFPADDPQYSCIVLTFYPKRNMFGAASTSGQVMKNIALKMYSRGMLDNTSDYTADSHPDNRALLYGTNDPGRHGTVRRAAGIKTVIHPAAPGQFKSDPKHPAVPGVTGLGLREAVVALEKQGYNVRFHGTGYVASQTPARGTPLAKGSIVTLALAQ